MVASLEDASEGYIWKDELENNFTSVAVMNASTEQIFQESPGEVDHLFGIKINKSMTSIHVPLEVYEGCKHNVYFESSGDESEIDSMMWKHS